MLQITAHVECENVVNTSSNAKLLTVIEVFVHVSLSLSLSAGAVIPCHLLQDGGGQV